MFSKSLANEFIKDNIRVNTINPGLVLTPDWVKTAKQLTAGKGGDWQAYLESVADEHAPIRRFASPEEIADFFVFLCSAGELLGRLDLLRRRRHAEDALTAHLQIPMSEPVNFDQVPGWVPPADVALRGPRLQSVFSSGSMPSSDLIRLSSISLT